MAAEPKTARELEDELKKAHAYIGQLWLAIMKCVDSETMEAIHGELRTVRAKQSAELARSVTGMDCECENADRTAYTGRDKRLHCSQCDGLIDPRLAGQFSD